MVLKGEIQLNLNYLLLFWCQLTWHPSTPHGRWWWHVLFWISGKNLLTECSVNWFFHVFGFVTGSYRGSLGELFLAADWQVRVFGLSGLVDRPSDHLPIQTISSVWMHGQEIPLHPLLLSNMTGMPQENLQFSCLPNRTKPLRQTLSGSARVLKMFRWLNCLGITPHRKKYPPKTGSFIT